MKIEYDKEADAGYIYLVDEIKEGEAAKTIELDPNIILDFEKNGKLLGIEVLNASKVLSKDVLLKSNIN
ncbi:MAG: DUF2283 domain-containing protein [Nanoarchaeota archaeon]|nr:DUF2283 domain-containing protein [Nanoarchaeota archaeon]